MKTLAHPHSEKKSHKPQPSLIPPPTGKGSSVFILGGVVEPTRKMQEYSGHFRRLVSDYSSGIKGRGIDPFIGETHSAMLTGRLEDKLFSFKFTHKGQAVEYHFDKRTQLGDHYYLWTGKVVAPNFVGHAQARLIEIKSELLGPAYR
jgi:hypothetical protein